MMSVDLTEHAGIIKELLDDAARRGEVLVNRARLFVGLGAILWTVAIVGPIASFTHLIPAIYLGVGAIVVAVCIAFGARLRHGPMTTSFLLASVCFDTIAVTLWVVAQAFLIPAYTGTYAGVFASPIFAFYLLAIVAAGARLSRRMALAGGALNSAVALSITVIEIPHRSGVEHLGFPELLAGTLALAATSWLSYLIATRTRDLVMATAAEATTSARAQNILGSYVAPAVAKEMLTTRRIALGGKHQEVTVLFSDLRGFTTMSENIDPEELVTELNEYFEIMVAAIHDAGGVVDKFIGDSIMAVFGAPEPDPDSAGKAIVAALSMRAALHALNRIRSARGQEPLGQGIGIHCGMVVAGNVGARSRMSYTVVGDAVNVAARIESMCRELNEDILVSAATWRRAAAGLTEQQQRSARDLGLTPLRGRGEKVQLISLARGS